MENIVEVSHLSKSIGKNKIINDLSFQVKPGEIFGFLGPNGSGKTTTIRMMVDLISMDKGSIKILGHDITKDREKALAPIGAVVENPELYGYLSGRENLNQIARIRNIPKSKIDEVVALVGLTGRIQDKLRKYSLGMKQRLGLAAALLSDPKLLILDEPTNGLDPNGIIEFRAILKGLAREKNMAVFVSSHILGEIQQLCDTVAFIEDGVITSVETLENIKKSVFFILESPVTKETTTFLNNHTLIKSVKEDNKLYLIELNEAQPEVLLKDIVTSGIPVYSFARHLKELEERYLEVIKGGIR
ncbi:MAG: ABC transporter ATP-binding protein [Clostridium sp.]|jgi:ABC-2 type transport system ATP-binding protein|nr:ABC transporter ATP-binding protein [Clostridium sp.]